MGTGARSSPASPSVQGLAGGDRARAKVVAKCFATPILRDANTVTVVGFPEMDSKMPSEQSTQAERSQRHRAGVAHQLREIRQSLPEILDEMRALRRDVDSRLRGLLDTMASEKGQRQ
jgi:hypothetical protein